MDWGQEDAEQKIGRLICHMEVGRVEGVATETYPFFLGKKSLGQGKWGLCFFSQLEERGLRG